MSAYQDIFVHDWWPNWANLVFPDVLAALLCVIGLRMFRDYAGEIVDEL